MERDVRLVWCGLVVLWIPGIYYSHEARCYSLVFLMATACTIAFVNLLAQPTLRNASGWALLGCTAILVQYHSLLLVGCQGISYLAMHRARALRTWPAGLLFFPAFMWLGIHAPRLLQYVDIGAAYQPVIKMGNIPEIGLFVFGSQALAIGLTTLAVVLGALARQGNASPDRKDFEDYNCWIAVGAAVAGAIVTISFGILRPSFTSRYLMVFMPGILLGLALLANRLSRRWTLVPAGILLLYAIFAVSWSVHAKNFERNWSFEDASRELARNNIDQLVFLFDLPPLSGLMEQSTLEALGGFFLQRQGLAPRINAVKLRAGDDPDKALLASTPGPRSAFLWVYSKTPSPSTNRSPIPQIATGWKCDTKVFGEYRGVVACLRNF
jgi:hypothetical protein